MLIVMWAGLITFGGSASCGLIVVVILRLVNNQEDPDRYPAILVGKVLFVF